MLRYGPSFKSYVFSAFESASCPSRGVHKNSWHSLIWNGLKTDELDDWTMCPEACVSCVRRSLASLLVHFLIFMEMIRMICTRCSYLIFIQNATHPSNPRALGIISEMHAFNNYHIMHTKQRNIDDPHSTFMMMNIILSRPSVKHYSQQYLNDNGISCSILCT